VILYTAENGITRHMGDTIPWSVLCTCRIRTARYDLPYWHSSISSTVWNKHQFTVCYYCRKSVRCCNCGEGL